MEWIIKIIKIIRWSKQFIIKTKFCRYESDRFSMCSEKISHGEARKMLSESEQRFSVILDSLDQDSPDDSFLENERLMQQQASKLG